MIHREKKFLENWQEYYALNFDFFKSEEFIKMLEDFNLSKQEYKEFNDICKEIFLENEDKKQEKINNLKEKYREIIVKIIQNWWVKNILKDSKIDDEKIGSWCDSYVFWFEKFPNYVYKESVKMDYNSFLYAKNSFSLFKKYFWDLIPRSYFFFWEWLENTYSKELSRLSLNIEKRTFTIQKRIIWKDLWKLSDSERENEKYLEEILKASKKYILYKQFLVKKAMEAKFNRKELEFDLELWDLVKWNKYFERNRMDLVSSKIKTANIMWDGEKLYFIDFCRWTWDDEKQNFYDFMMSKETLAEWKKFLEENK